jgi:hypothetical protein
MILNSNAAYSGDQMSCQYAAANAGMGYQGGAQLGNYLKDKDNSPTEQALEHLGKTLQAAQGEISMLHERLGFVSVSNVVMKAGSATASPAPEPSGSVLEARIFRLTEVANSMVGSLLEMREALRI